ncbi:hypothetical protein FRC03_009791 [Tulasnella sp. 419]|nr:hypothetical protein FRC02_003664 [Tulasnella sp. 418]KAG8967538.1 hypothetical protein FRC03_009791 [Tulasnella sp. 419]
MAPTASSSLALDLFSKYPTPAVTLAAIGSIAVAGFALNFLKFLFQTFITPGQSLKKFGAKQGAWAVITGATDGIGLEFADQLAKAGFNVLLVSRTKSKLEKVAADLESKHKVQTKVYAIDFSRPDEAAYRGLRDVVKSTDVRVLVNNVGRSYDMPTYFHELSNQNLEEIVEINIRATLKVTQIVLPVLLAHKNGLILNIGSFAGEFPSPMLAVYSGAKSFLSTWSQALADEYKGQGITVQLVNTYFVVSSMSKIRKANVMVPTPKAYVKSVLSKIGLPCGAGNIPYTSTPYWSHAAMEWILRVLNMPKYYIKYSHDLHIDIRRRALKKLEREAKKGN